MTPADKQFRTKPAVAADSIRADILRLFFDARWYGSHILLGTWPEQAWAGSWRLLTTAGEGLLLNAIWPRPRQACSPSHAAI